MNFCRNHTLSALSPFRTALLAGLCLAAAMVMLACGKSGFPQPQDTAKTFSWKEINAKMAGKCIAFSGSIEGAYQYFDGIRLELAGYAGPEDCPGCPFVPEEITELSVHDSGFDSRDGSFGFSYCPREAGMYRWRLAGLSSFNRIPHAIMTERMLVVTD